MRRRLGLVGIAGAGFLVLVLIAVPVLAQSGGGYDLTWSAIDGGGVSTASGGGYLLGATAGQPAAGVLTGGGSTLRGGFWGGGTRYPVFLPLVIK